jgi:hypothetical protein
MRQIIGQVSATAGWFRRGRRFQFRGCEFGLDPGDVRLQLLQPEIELIGIEPFGAPPEDGAQHLSELLTQSLQLRQIGLLALNDLSQSGATTAPEPSVQFHASA